MSQETYRLFKKFRAHGELTRDYLEVAHRETPGAFMTRVRASLATIASKYRQPLQDRLREFVTRFAHEAETIHVEARRIYRHSNSEPFDDVYECACLFFLNSAFWQIPVHPALRPVAIESTEPISIGVQKISDQRIEPRGSVARSLSSLYRGVGSIRYENIASLIRPDGAGRRRASKEAIEARCRRIASFRSYLRTFREYRAVVGPSLEHRESFELAFMQHFKLEAGLCPPMIDFTYDPFVALYFASCRPVEGDTGVLYRLSPKADFAEFRGFSTVGELSLIVLPSIQRLARQRGVLLENPVGNVVDQLVPFQLTFLQREGNRFLDRELGITDEDLLPYDSSIVEFLRGFDGFEDEPAALGCIEVRPYSEQNEILASLVDYARARGVLSSRHSDELDRLQKLAIFHVSLERDASLAASNYSIRSLLRTADDILRADSPLVAVHREYCSYMDPEAEGKILGHYRNAFA